MGTRHRLFSLKRKYDCFCRCRLSLLRRPAHGPPGPTSTQCRLTALRPDRRRALCGPLPPGHCAHARAVAALLSPPLPRRPPSARWLRTESEGLLCDPRGGHSVPTHWKTAAKLEENCDYHSVPSHCTDAARHARRAVHSVPMRHGHCARSRHFQSYLNCRCFSGRCRAGWRCQ